jgi:phosphoribosylaminoimidazole carboxylase (NCAIR synthetase)
MDTRTIGVLGGGQLGRMLVESGARLGLKIAILDPGVPFLCSFTSCLMINESQVVLDLRQDSYHNLVSKEVLMTQIK